MIALTRVGGASRMLALVDTGIALRLFAISDCKKILRLKLTGDMHLDRRLAAVDYGVTPTTVSEEKQIYEASRRQSTDSKSCMSWPTCRTGQ